MITPDMTSGYLYSNKIPPSGLGIVIHATGSGTSMNPTEFSGTLNWFKNPASKVSAHWVVSRTGTKCRVVPDTEQAWHAGEHNETHFGIELESAVEADGFTSAQMQACVDICRAYMKDFRIPGVHDFIGMIGHQETPQGRRQGKTDPGSKFPWTTFIEQINFSPHVFIVGNEMGGIEKRGKQLFIWNERVTVDAIGDFDGNFPGEHWHNQGGVWVKILP